MTRRGHILSVLTALALMSCVTTATDNQVALGGIGGTGATSWEGGIGGTGVVGTITEFGSIVINGLHVHYDPNQIVESAQGGMIGADFAIGQVVAAETQMVGGRLIARRLVHAASLVGAIESIDMATGTIIVGGEAVRVLPGVDVVGLAVGERVVVDGLRGADGVEASRIAKAKTSAQDAVAGTVTEIVGQMVEIDGVRKIAMTMSSGGPLRVGDYVMAMGVERTADGAYQAGSVHRAFGPMFDGRVSRLAQEAVFAKGARAVPGIGALAGLPEGRGVVFVTRERDGTARLDGAAKRSAERWRETLTIRAKSDGEGRLKNGASGGGAGGGRSGGGSDRGGRDGGGSDRGGGK